MKIAITGGIGSGKSSVAKIISDSGFPVYSCDDINREILEEKYYVEKLEKLFPRTVENGRVLKRKLGDIVFSDEQALKKLNELAHPLIMQELIKRMDSEKSDLVFAEVPLLFEGKFEYCFDKILVVLRSKSARIAAVSKRDQTDEEQVLARINNQFDYESFSQAPPQKDSKIYLLNNVGDFCCLKRNTAEILKHLQSDVKHFL